MSVGEEPTKQDESSPLQNMLLPEDAASAAPVATAEATPVAENVTPQTSSTSSVTGFYDGARSMAVMPRRQVRTGRVTCQWLYNQVQASRGMILIDTRPRAAFEDDSIPSALSIPPMPHCRTLSEVEDGMLPEQRYLFSAKKRKLRDVVLFGEAVKAKSKSPQSMRSRTEESAEHAWLRYLERLIIQDGQVTSVKLLNDGFVTFRYRYPFYTTSAMLEDLTVGLTRTHSGTHNLNYPNEILEGFLFLGNMWHAQSRQVVQHLGITHIVNASLDIENVFEDEGVRYHEVKIKDKPDSDISVYFDSTFAFIESAKRTKNGRVLVHCTQGISRSATLVIMYLMRANNWSLVTAVNFAIASRGVVYPNEGFVRSLMLDEFRLYKGNSIAQEEVDTLLQNQIPDRPLPLEMLRPHKSERCSLCCKDFSLLEWKHKCNYCRKEFCSKCTGTRLAQPEREKAAMAIDDLRKPKRVCDVCVSRLWQINLPRPRKGLPMRSHRCRHLNVNSLSTFGKPVCISYFDGTEPEVIIEVIKRRFGVQNTQIVDLSFENGEPVRDLSNLPDETAVLVSIGKAGNVQELFTQRTVRHERSRGSERERRKDRMHLRERFSSEGNANSPLNKFTDMRRSCSYQHIQTEGSPSGSPASATTTTKPRQARTTPQELARMEEKFRELWKLSFPTMAVLERTELLSLREPAMLMDVMLGISSMSCGAITPPIFNRRLGELGYSDEDREQVMALVNKARVASDP